MSVLNSPHWIVGVLFCVHLIVHIMGKLTLSVYYFDLNTVKKTSNSYILISEIIIFRIIIDD